MNDAAGKTTGRLWKWTKRIAGAFLLFIAVAATMGFVYQRQADQAILLYPPPGKLVDIGGYRLHLRCTGDGWSFRRISCAFPPTARESSPKVAATKWWNVRRLS